MIDFTLHGLQGVELTPTQPIQPQRDQVNDDASSDGVNINSLSELKIKDKCGKMNRRPSSKSSGG